MGQVRKTAAQGPAGADKQGKEERSSGEGGIRAETGVLAKAGAKDEEPGERKQGKGDLQAILVLGDANMLQ